jgi:hypothetical protein
VVDELPPLLRELAHEREQNRRLVKAVTSSRTPAYRFLCMSDPQVSQGFPGTTFCNCGIGYFLFDFQDALGAKSSQSLGKPINHLLWAGFNWPRFIVGAEEPVGVSPETSKRVFRELHESPASL